MMCPVSAASDGCSSMAIPKSSKPRWSAGWSKRIAAGGAYVRIGLLEALVHRKHPCLEGARIIEAGYGITGNSSVVALAHATCLASMLVGRGERVLSLCPDCTLLNVPIIDEAFQMG